METTGTNPGKKVLVEMSGGVDSSVCAGILRDEGYDCTGFTFDVGNSDSQENLKRAESVCRKLGIKHCYADFSDLFKKEVISYFINEYSSARTPNPCMLCNIHLKFGAVLHYALQQGFDYIATGHYAAVMKKDPCSSLYSLNKAEDPIKDQSYFLSALNQEVLRHVLLPLGFMTKNEVRKAAVSYGFENADDRESQDICFIPDGDYVSFILNRNPSAEKLGEFRYRDGKVLGRNAGVVHFTIGQRRGTGVAMNHPVYVTELDGGKDIVYIGEKEDLYKDRVLLSHCRFISGSAPSQEFDAEVKIRYQHKAAPAAVHVLPDNAAEVIFFQPQMSVTPGQYAVFYSGQEVIGCGIIERGYSK